MPVTAIIYICLFFGLLITGLILDASWCMYLYELHYFANPENRWWGMHIPSFLTSFLVSAALLLAYAIRYQKYSETKISQLPQAKWLLSLLVLMIITGLYAVWPEQHWKYLNYHIKLLIVLAVSYKVIDSASKLDKAVLFYLVGVLYIGYLAWSIGRTGYGRLEGIGMLDAPDANDTAAVLASAVPLIFFYLIKGHYWEKGFAVISLAFILNGLILINSRGAFLGLIVGFFYIFIISSLANQLKLSEKRILISAIFLGALLFLYLADQTFWNRMNTIVNLSKEVSRGEEVGRVYFWMKTFSILKHHPFGVGACGYQFLSPTFLPESMLTKGLAGVVRQRAVHSTYFQVLAEYGYLGFALFISLIISNFLALKKVRSLALRLGNSEVYFRVLSFEAGLISFLIAAIFIDRFYAVVLYWLMLFCAICYNIYYLKVKRA